MGCDGAPVPPRVRPWCGAVPFASAVDQGRGDVRPQRAMSSDAPVVALPFSVCPSYRLVGVESAGPN